MLADATDDTRGFAVLALLIDERSGVGKGLRRLIDLAQPLHCVVRGALLRMSNAGAARRRQDEPQRSRDQRRPGRITHCVSLWTASSETVRMYGATPCSVKRGE